MRIVFPKGDKDNPFRFFDYIYTIKGQNNLKREFIQEVFNIDEGLYNDPDFDLLNIECDLENEIFNDRFNSDYSFKIFLEEKYRSHSIQLITLLRNNLLYSSLSKVDYSHKVNIFSKKIDSYVDTVRKSEFLLLEKQIKYLNQIQNKVNKLSALNSSLKKTTKQNKVSLEYENQFLAFTDVELKKIISDLSHPNNQIKFLKNPDDQIKLFNFLTEKKEFDPSIHKIETKCGVLQLCFIIREWIKPKFKNISYRDLCKLEIFIKKTGKLIKEGDISTNKSSPKNESKIKSILKIY